MPSDDLLTSVRQQPLRALGLTLLLALIVRLLVFPINEHVYGDAIARTELAEQWARAPHVISAFGNGAYQFGPLHLYLVGAALTWFDRDIASRLVSLIFGLLTIVPVFALTRHYFGGTSALLAAFGMAVWGLHVQVSTTGGSEALSLFLMWTAFAWFARAIYRPHIVPIACAALALNLAAATRYDAWMYIPPLAVAPAWLVRDRRAGVRTSLLFLLFCLPFPIYWLAGNAIAHGDAFYPLDYIDDFHASWAATERATMWRDVWLRLQGLGFWPAMAVVTLTPGVALLGLIGMVSAWRIRPLARWLVVAAVAPAAYYTARTTLFADFVPLARFTIVQVSLLLPFVGSGLAWVAGEYGATVTRHVLRTSLALALLLPIGLGIYTWRSEGWVATVLEPLSPVTTNPRALMAAAAFLREEAAASSRSVALDVDERYGDLTIGFYARLPPETTIRLRWPGRDALLLRRPADLLVVFDRGRLRTAEQVRDGGDLLHLGTTTYRVRWRSAPVRIFERLAER